MGLLYIPLEREMRDRLNALARRERRRPQDQAAVLLERALRDDDFDNEVAERSRLEAADVAVR